MVATCTIVWRAIIHLRGCKRADLLVKESSIERLSGLMIAVRREFGDFEVTHPFGTWTADSVIEIHTLLSHSLSIRLMHSVILFKL